MKAKITHSFDVPAHKMWRLMFDASFVRRVYLGCMDARSFELLEHDLTGDPWLFRAAVAPKPFVPARVLELMDQELSFEQSNYYDKRADLCTGELVSRRDPHKLRATYTIQVADTAQGGCVRTVHIDARANTFGIAGLLERAVISQFERFLEEAARLYAAEQFAGDRQLRTAL